MYQYKAELVRVVDGDTVDLRIDLGFCMTTVQRCRLLGYDAPEMSGSTIKMGKLACVQLGVLLFANGQGKLTVWTEKDDSFGRYLAKIHVDTPDGEIKVVETLIARGFGHAWNGKPGTRIPFDPSQPYPLKA